MTSANTSETVATYTVAGKTYEIDHLGINYPEQWGEYAVYHDGQQLAEFGVEEMCLATVRRPALMPTTEDLIKLAVQAVAEYTGDDGPVYPQPGAPIPLELNGGMDGYVVGECQHRMYASDWRAGCRNCERCGGEMATAQAVARLLARAYNEWMKVHGPDTDGAVTEDHGLTVVYDGTVYEVTITPQPADTPIVIHRSCGLLDCTEPEHLGLGAVGPKAG